MLSRSMQNVLDLSPDMQPETRELIRHWLSMAQALESDLESAKNNIPVRVVGFTPFLAVDNDEPEPIQPIEVPVR